MKIKNVFIILLTAILIPLSSCVIDEYSIYELAGTYDDSTLLNYTGLSYNFNNSDEYIDENKKLDKYEINELKYNLIYSNTDRQYMFTYDKDNYYNEEKDVNFSFKKGSDTLVYAYVNSSSEKYLYLINGNVNENNYKNQALEVMSEYIDIKEYEVSCSTLVKIKRENGTENVKYDYFYDDIENEAQYTFVFTKKLDGYLISDSANIILTNDGRVISLSINMKDEYEKFDNIKIDEKKLNNIIEDKMNSLCNNDKINSFEYKNINSMLIIGNNNDLLLLTDIEAEIILSNNSNENLNERCKLLVKIN